MATWRTVASLVVTLTLAGAARAQTYPLKEDTPAGTCTRVKLTMSLSGELKVQRDGKSQPLQETASAAHDYYERVLEAGSAGLAEKAARHYKTARVSIAVGAHKSERTLPADRRELVVVQRVKDALLTYTPKGPFTREDLQITEHLDSLAVTGLLPGREVKVGETWQLANPVAQALCHFEGLTTQELTGKLEQVKDEVATFSVTGSAAGIDLGASVKVKAKASGRFDLKARRLIALEWKQTDEREQGPVSPAASAEITYTLERAALSQPPPEVSDFALVPIPQGATPPESMTQLTYRDHRGLYQMQYARDWHVVARTDEHLVLRLMDRGEFVAQVTFTPWKKHDAGKHFTPDEFKEILASMPGWRMEKVLREEEVKDSGHGNWVYLLAAEGETGGVSAVQCFYLLAGPQGDHLLVAFTMTPVQVQKLGSRDLALVRAVAFPGAAPEGMK
ncbi:MAG: hypothetical protein L0Z62_38505 [Gemmataceae bacterium]|nr:hypothetical protein [Gemmataceae bacterium]